MLALGFLFSILLAVRRAKKAGENPDHIYNISVWIVISSLIGARLYYVITHYAEFRAPEGTGLIARVFIELRNMFWPIGSDGQVGISGLIYYGGLILAVVATVVYIRRHRLNLPRYLDILAPSIPLGEAFTRIGCFLNGCCFGRPTDSVFGVVFPDSCAAGTIFEGQPIHPAQLYNSFAALLIMGLILWLERYKRFDGYSAALFFMLYPAARFVTDFLRYYEEGMKTFGLSQNQIVSVMVFVAASSVFIYLLRKHGTDRSGTGR
jgi:phosphatidylglycerol:prolipoprotein diacylglycerol transferase